MKLLFFDLETTGLDPASCAIHQLSGMVVIDGEERERFNLFIKPHEGAVIDQSALALRGLTREILSLHTSSAEAHKEFIKILRHYVNPFDKGDKFYLVGFNSRSFDEPFLRKWFERNDNNFYGSFFWQIGFDVMVLAAEHLKHSLPSMPNFKLHTVAAQLGLTVDATKLHDALYDIELTQSIYNSIQRPTDGRQLARQALEVLDAQQKFFQVARTGAAGKSEALERSKKLEAALKSTCEAIVTPKPQPTLF